MKIAFCTGAVLLASALSAVAGDPQEAPGESAPESIEQGAARSADEMATLMEADPEFAASGSAELARLMANMIRNAEDAAPAEMAQEPALSTSAR